MLFMSAAENNFEWETGEKHENKPKMAPVTHGLTINVSVFSGTDGGLSLCSAQGPDIGDGQNSYSLAGQDHWSSHHAVHLTYKGYYDGTHCEEEREKLSHVLHCRQIGTLIGHLLILRNRTTIKNIIIVPIYNTHILSCVTWFPSF